MVTAVDLRVDRGALDGRTEGIGDDEVVDPPSNVPLAGFCKVAPPRVGSLFIRMEETEGIGEAFLQKGIHFSALFICEACILMVRSGIGKVDVFMGDIEVAAEDDRLFLRESCHIVCHRILPCHAVGKTREAALAVRRVADDEIVTAEIGGDDTPLLIMLLDAKAIGDGKRFPLREECSTTVALLHGTVPVLVVAGKHHLDLVRLQLRLLQAHAVCIECCESVHETFLHAGSETIDVPGNIFQCPHGCSPYSGIILIS